MLRHFVKEPMPESSGTNRKHYQLVARVSNEIRERIKKNKDTIFVDLTAHRIVDRFYIKRCNKCQKFGHYQDNCTSDKIRCVFCCSDSHCSSSCPIKNQDTSNFSCPNCKDANKDFSGHSSHWFKCPTCLEVQNKLKSSIPFYSAKNEL